jgi:hypothetical protein
MNLNVYLRVDDVYMYISKRFNFYLHNAYRYTSSERFLEVAERLVGGRFEFIAVPVGPV